MPLVYVGRSLELFVSRAVVVLSGPGLFSLVFISLSLASGVFGGLGSYVNSDLSGSSVGGAISFFMPPGLLTLVGVSQVDGSVRFGSWLLPILFSDSMEGLFVLFYNFSSL